MSNVMFLNHSDCSCNSCSSLLKYFEISKCFEELNTEVQKALARYNLGIGDELSLKWGNIKGFIEKLKDLTLYLKALLLSSDEEDVTVVDGKIKFKDRDNTNGMGYVILRKNKSFAEQVIKENTIYEIRYDFDLNGTEVTIPEGCVLKFEGGKLSNGKLIGDNTKVLYNSTIFNNIRIAGTWNIPVIKTSMFSNLSNNGLKELFALQNKNIHNDIFIEKGDYIVKFPNSLPGVGCLELFDDVNLQIDGNISLDDEERNADLCKYGYRMIIIYGNNIHISGTGTLIGDIENHGYKTKVANGHGIYLDGGNNIEIEGLCIRNFAGDCIGVSKNCLDVLIHDIEVSNWGRNSISAVEFRNLLVKNVYAHDGGYRDPWSIIDIEPNKDFVTGMCSIENITGVNVGVGINSSGTDTAIIGNISIKDVILDGCKGDFIHFDGNGGDYLSISNVEIKNIPTDHSTAVGDFITIYNWKNVDIKNLKLDASNLGTNFSSYPITIQGIKSVNISESTIISYRAFSWHLTKATIKNCFLKSMSLLWANTSSPVELHIDNCDIEGTVDISGKNSSFTNCYIHTSNEYQATDYIINLTGNTSDTTNGVLVDNNIIINNQTSVSQYASIINVEASNCILKNNRIVSTAAEGVTPFTRGITFNKFGTCINNTFIGPFSTYKVRAFNTAINADSYLPNIGTTEDRNTINVGDSRFNQSTYGLKFFDLSLGKPVWYNYVSWVDCDGYTPAPKFGTTRPSLQSTDVGYCFFDNNSDINKPIYWTGTKWVDATGADV